MGRLLLALPALLAVATLAGAGPPGSARADAAPAGDTVTVTGTGSVETVPDVAQLTFGAETRGGSAQASLAANASTMRRLIDTLRKEGARDVATQWVSVWPISAEGGTIDGYSASNSVSATIDVEHAGAVIDAAVGAGADQVSGPGLTRSDADRLNRRALAAAVSDARLRAEALAKAAGRTLGGISAISETGAPPVPYFERAALSAASETPVVPGTQETTATVSVTFALV